PAAIATALPNGTRTAYLRTRFVWDRDPAGVLFVVTNLLSDGAAFHLNGAEARRIRLPSGTLDATTAATGGPATLGQASVFALDPSALVVGENVWAVEVHQSSGSPEDLVFGASLTATTAFPVTLPDPTRPADRAVVAGESTTFETEVVATGPVSYQWLRDGVPIDGATNAVWTIETVLAENAGAYAVRVSNPQTPNGVTSRAAKLDVLGTPVVLTTQPVAQQVAEGLPVSFSVVASGSAPLRYQWFKDSSPIEGATASTYAIARARLEDAGQYSVEVSNPTPSSRRSTPVALTVVRDSSPPSLLAVAGGPDKVTLTFSEPLDPAEASKPSNYSFAGGLQVFAAAPSVSDEAVVVLTTGRQTLGTRYELTVVGVRDRYGNPVPAGTRRAFVSTIQIDGSFDDWTGLEPVVDDPEDAENATDYATAWIANDADYIYLRVRLHRPSDLGIFYNNLFVDADNTADTGFRFRAIGSEMLIQGGGGYQQKGGGFNEGGVEGLDWLLRPEGVASEFELRFSRRARFATDGQAVFGGDSIAFFLESENTSFQTVDVAPDAEPVVYTFVATPPADLGTLRAERSTTGLRLSWDSAGRLQAADRLTGPWSDVPGAASPFDLPVSSGTARFVRLAR
ncbi:MAG: immunoglobulin domain-containing protein, partial [Verrucomicrobiales bacterium]|nr:immunoglobulin domain-containing protein [Verrucomicrobiales bacterium]